MVSIPSEPAKRDAGDDESAPVLLELVGSIAFPAGEILVPCCGAGHDALALAGPSNAVTGIDPRAGSAERFARLRAELGVPPALARFVAADPWRWDRGAAFGAIWDAAWLPSVAPPRRAAWAERVAALLAPGGALVVLLHPVLAGATVAGAAAPPYPVDPDELAAQLAAAFERVELRPVARSHPARRGREWLGRWRKR